MTGPEFVDLRDRAIERLQKKRDFQAHLLAYLTVNTVLVAVWAMTGSGLFWPAFPMLGWGIGVFFHAWDTYARGLSEDQIGREMDRLTGWDPQGYGGSRRAPANAALTRDPKPRSDSTHMRCEREIEEDPVLQFPTATHAQPAADFDIRVERADGAPRLVATGELDMLTGPLLASGLTELRSEGSTTTVDLAGLTFLDMAGIRVLWKAVEGSVDSGGSMSIVNCSDQIRRLFYLTGTEHLLWDDAESDDRRPGVSAHGASLSLAPTA